MQTLFIILSSISWIYLIYPIPWFNLFLVDYLIRFNWFNYFDSILHYASLHLHMGGVEDIYDKPRPHKKYTGTVYTYIPNCFGSSNPGWTRTEVYPKLELV